MKRVVKFWRFADEMLGPAGKILPAAFAVFSALAALFGQSPPDGNWVTQLLGIAPWYVWTVASLVTALLCVLIRGYWIVQERTRGLQLFLDRNELQRVRGSFNSELNDVERVWLMCPAGSVLHEDHSLLGKIDRLLLSDTTDELTTTEYARRIKSDLNGLRFTCQGSVQFGLTAERAVRTTLMPFFGLVIANPKSEGSWARMELLLPHLDAAVRPSLMVTKRDNALLFGRLLKAFEESWSNATIQSLTKTDDGSAAEVVAGNQRTDAPVKLTITKVYPTRSQSRTQSYPFKLRVYLRNNYGEDILIENPYVDGNLAGALLHSDRIVRFKVGREALTRFHLANGKEVEMWVGLNPDVADEEIAQRGSHKQIGSIGMTVRSHQKEYAVKLAI